MTHANALVSVGPMTDYDETDLPDQAYLEGRTFESSTLTELMEPYNENTEVPRYRDYRTIAEKAREIVSITKPWEKHDATLDVRFRPEPRNPRDRGVSPNMPNEWKAAWDEYDKERKEWEQHVASLYTDEEVAAAYNTYWTREESGDRLYVGDDGAPHETLLYRWSTYNPQSKWDYWQIIGNGLYLKDGTEATIARKRDIDWDRMFTDRLPSYALVDEEHGWFEKGHLGWWGTSWDEKDDHDERYRAIVDGWGEDDVIVLCDYHI